MDFRSSASRRSRHRATNARGAAGAQLRRARARAAAGRGDGARASSPCECRQTGCEGPRRWVDGGDARQKLVSPLRTHCSSDVWRALDSDGAGNTSGGAEIAGTVIEQLPSRLFRVRLESGAELTAHISGRINRNFVRLLVGDRVRRAFGSRWSRGRIVRKI